MCFKSHTHTHIYMDIFDYVGLTAYTSTQKSINIHIHYIYNIKHICKLYICMYINIYVNGTKIQVRNSTEK